MCAQPAHPLASLCQLNAPAYVAHRAKIRANLAVAARIKRETNCRMLLATKAFSMFSLFDEFAKTLDGTTASGLYEARLGREHFKGEVHVFSPGFTADEIAQLLPIADHFYFNSLSQFKRFAPACTGKKIGLRVNPQFRQVKNSVLYDPSAKGSRFGVLASDVTPEILAQIEILHIHNLCENMAEDSLALIDHLIKTMPHLLQAVSTLNLGGGHYITHPNYDVDALIAAINRLQNQFDLQVILEPGGALVYDAGYLVAQVVDMVENDGMIAILNISATCHMPDVLEMPYTPPLLHPKLTENAQTGDSENGGQTITLAGKTCLTGDIIGRYQFEKPLEIGDTIIFGDMMQYSMVKTTSFNGMPLPDIAIWEEEEKLHIIKRFTYEDFQNRLS
jgi:carboxynorspermidine decarboxylase